MTGIPRRLCSRSLTFGYGVPSQSEYPLLSRGESFDLGIHRLPIPAGQRLYVIQKMDGPGFLNLVSKVL